MKKKFIKYLFLTYFLTSVSSVFGQMKVIYETDLDTNIDDACALGMLHALAANDVVELLAVIHNTSGNYGPGYIVDVTHLHIKEWLDCICSGETTTVNIERAFEEGITTVMAQKSYLEKRRVEWDQVNKKIV